MLSQNSEYALRAMVFLAEDQGAAKTPAAISAATKIPGEPLQTVLQVLVAGGLVSRQGDDFVMLRAPQDVTMYEVVHCVNPITRITTCPLDIAQHGSNLCSLHRRLDNLMASVETALRRMTIAQLLVEAESNKPLCGFPHRA